MKLLTAALLTTLLTAGAFPPFGWGSLAFVALVPLMVYCDGGKDRPVFLAGWLGGWAASTAVVWWVVNTITHYGGLPWGLALPILLLLTWAMGAFWAVFFWARARIRKRWPLLPGLVVAPALWVALEFIRGHLPELGFPWALLGASQYQNLPLIQGADIFGIWGISFFVVMVNSAAASLLQAAGRGRVARLLPCAVVIAVTALAYAYGSHRLEGRGDDGSLRVTVLQGNVDQEEKWLPGNRKRTYDLYAGLTAETAGEGVDLVVWPETALPLVFERERAYRERIKALAIAVRTPILFGTPGVEGDGATPTLRNRAYLVDGRGTIRGHYDKMHLVPFGEYVPWKKLLFFVEKMVGMTGEFTAGSSPTLLPAGDRLFGTLICYEVVFPDLVRRSVRDGASFLVNITNDAWFGRTAASEQHFAALVFRAVENRRPIARAANTGISGFVDSRGRILQASEIFVQGSYTGGIDPSHETTIYTRRGDWFPLSCLFAALFLMAGTLRRKRDRRYRL